MDPPPPGCWDCGARPSDEDRALRAVLVPRTAAEGGPVTLLDCGACGDRGALESLPDGAAVLVPVEAVGVAPPSMPLLRGAAEAARRSRARVWAARWRSAVEALRRRRFQSGADAEPAPPPPPPPKSGARGTPPPPPVPPPPRPASPRHGPLSEDEARSLLGVDAAADGAAVEAAYRRAARSCHPDLVAHLDVEFQALAHAKFLRVKEARDLLRRRASPLRSDPPGEDARR